MKITLAVITSNDESMIQRFMEHHRPHVDEIVWADDASTDRTREIASQYADKSILNKKREYNCEFYRQQLTDLSSNDWILMCDSDYFVDFSIVDKLREIADDLEEKKIYSSGAWFQMITDGCDFCGVAPCAHVVLTNKKHVRWSIFPHVGALYLDPDGTLLIKRASKEFNIGTIWHIPKKPGVSPKEHRKAHVVKMYRWLDVCKYYLTEYTDDTYKWDRKISIQGTTSGRYNLQTHPYFCSRDPDKLIWIEDDNEVYDILLKMGIPELIGPENAKRM